MSYRLLAVVVSTVCLSVDSAELTDERLLGAANDTANWLTYSRDYSNQRFSPLAQVNADSIKRLVPKWIYQSGVSSTFQSSPIVVDGVMYISLPFNHVVALQAQTGKQLWR